MVNNITAARLDSFYLKRNAEPIFRIMNSEPSPFLNPQITPDSIQETPKLRGASVNSKRIDNRYINYSKKLLLT